MFIKKNAEKWKAFQEEESSTPDDASNRFITLMDDLAYAKTFYPKSKATKWINGLAASEYQNIYKNKKEKYSRFFTFFKYELPLVIRRHHKIFLFTTLFFLIAVAVGVLSSIKNPEFLRNILGDDYVDMTERNIANGDPFGVYKEDSKFNMFITIGFNNIGVAFKAFIGGFIGGLPTVYILWYNGVMLGSFQQMFFANGLGYQSILVIWIHGVFEICSIVFSGVAGFVFISGVLFPGTYSRTVSFKNHFKDAAKIMICVVPFLIVAALLESHVTQLMSDTFDKKPDGIPEWASICILLASSLCIIWYFIVWPIMLTRRGFFLKKDNIVDRLNESND